MSNPNVPNPTPNRITLCRLSNDVVTGNLNNTSATFTNFQVPTLTRPDGAAASSATGGSANCRFVVTGVTHLTGPTIGTMAANTSVDIKVINRTALNTPVIASKTIANTAVATAFAVNSAFPLTLATTSTARTDLTPNPLTVPDTTLIAGDVICAQITETTAAGNVVYAAYSSLQVVGSWEIST